jgi:secondary thiamine-phosphate synthase enzyme
MNWHKTTLEISTRSKGLHDITETVRAQLRDWDVEEGMCFLFLPHTSASLVMSENWDPTARADLETFMERLVPERDDWYTHDLEGPDDATSHIRAMLTDTSLTIPIDDGNLSLGTWQGIYIFEHRAHPPRRKLLVRVLSVK